MTIRRLRSNPSGATNLKCLAASGAVLMNIVPYKSENFSALVRFVAAIQEHERVLVPELKSGHDISEQYAHRILKMVQKNNGTILIARDGDQEIGVICAWISEDDDMLLRDEFRQHAYISDIYVAENWQEKGIAKGLMQTMESLMRERGCQRIRVCSKATNKEATAFYGAGNFKPYEIIYSKELNRSA
jgi:ribosomal protein S18 acetylase RimI-like enzyme